MKKSLALILSAAMVLSLSACGSSSNESTPTEGADNVDTVSEAVPGELNVCLASEPDTVDPALNSTVDGGTMDSHFFAGLTRWDRDAEGHPIVVADMAEEIPEPVENEDGTVTYTYTLKEGAKWSDGEPLTASDFVFSWNRASSPVLAADYCYMYEVVDGYDKMWEVDADNNPINPDAKLNVEAPDDRTLVVTLSTPVPYWDQITAFPALYPVREDVVSNDAWATDPATFVCNGAYKMTAWDHNSCIRAEKNENYVDADRVTMDVINFYLSDDANNMLTNFENGAWQLIDDVPTNEISALKEKYPDEYFVDGQLGTYYLCWNVNANLLPEDSTLSGKEAAEANAEIRNAVSLLLDRNYLVNDVAQGGQVPASSFVAMGLTEEDGSEFYENAGNSSAFTGYYDVSEDALSGNYESAVETLKKYYDYDEASAQFTNVPAFTYIYNTGDAHKAIAEYIQSALSAVGITVNLENQEWNTFINTRKKGDFTMARNGWLADYNDPISFLDLWVTLSGNNDVQMGKGDNESLKAYSLDLTDLGYDLNVTDGTWAETYDALISIIKKCTDAETRFKLMHKAEDLLMSTGTITPLYFYTDIYMLSSNVKGFYANPTGMKYFWNTTIE